MIARRPIGIFDSGLGGLSVAREVKQRLRAEDILYIADSAYVPYGGRSFEEINARSLAVSAALLERGAKLIVVACNTASGAALELLRERFDVPIVGLEPAVKPAAKSTRSGRIAVLATPATLKTPRFNRLVDDHGPGIDVVKIPCPGFVELVESGDVSGERARELVGQVLRPLEGSGVDQVVLGCTHYPFLRGVIQEIVGQGVTILDSGSAVARQVERVLAGRHLLRSDLSGTFTFLTTGDAAAVRPIVARLWGAPVDVGEVEA
jgi:glutamate racemase